MYERVGEKKILKCEMQLSTKFNLELDFGFAPRKFGSLVSPGAAAPIKFREEVQRIKTVCLMHSIMGKSIVSVD